MSHKWLAAHLPASCATILTLVFKEHLLVHVLSRFNKKNIAWERIYL
jgi:hypothetical protein